MLFAVSIETTQDMLRGWARRVQRVFVDAADKDEARRRALQRFRGRPELRCVARAVVPVALPEEPPAVAQSRARVRPKAKRGRRKKRAKALRAPASNRNSIETRGKS